MAGNLRRGFKADAERIASEIRSEMGLRAIDRLECHRLAAHLEIPVVSLAELHRDGAGTESIRRLMQPRSALSALTVCDGPRRLIVFNPRHAVSRRSNSISHEVSHVILEHPPAPPLGEGGCRNWDPRLEEEADWQAAVLLVPRGGALAWFDAGGGIADGAAHFGVSVQLFRWRVNKTGIPRQLGFPPPPSGTAKSIVPARIETSPPF